VRGTLFARVVFIHEFEFVLAKMEVTRYCSLKGLYMEALVQRAARIGSECALPACFPENTGRIQRSRRYGLPAAGGALRNGLRCGPVASLLQSKKKTGAVSRIASRACLAYGRIKKPIFGQALDRRGVPEFQFPG
jgi:hypothetical protein